MQTLENTFWSTFLNRMPRQGHAKLSTVHILLKIVVVQKPIHLLNGIHSMLNGIHSWMNTIIIYINRNTKYIFWQCFKICSNLIIKKILSRIFYKSLEHFCSKKSKYWFYKIQNLGFIYTKFWVYLIWYYLTNHILYHQHNVQWYTFSSVYTVSTFAKFRLRGIFG